MNMKINEDEQFTCRNKRRKLMPLYALHVGIGHYELD